MSDLPEWINDVDTANADQVAYTNKLLEALSIAWEALQAIDKHQAIVSSSMSKYSVTRHLADDAMRRIEEIGK